MQASLPLRSGLRIALPLTLLFATPTLADTLHVPAEYSTIQAAIDAAVPGDIVLIADGVYTGPGNRDLDFAGKAITVKSAHGPENCIIDCEGTFEEPYRGVIFDDGETRAAILDGVTITGGATEVGAVLPQFNGGAIQILNDSSPTIRHCILRGNQAACWGGALSINHSSPRIENTLITENSSGDDGGGVFAWNGGEPVLVGVMITDNVAASIGGGVCDFGSSLVLVHVTIAGNTAPFGAGAYLFGSTLGNSIVWGNHGGVALEGSSNDVYYSDVEGGVPGVANVDLDPSFRDPVNGDYRLRFDSPCIDRGISQTSADPLPAFDIDRRDNRTIGFLDMGADEVSIDLSLEGTPEAGGAPIHFAASATVTQAGDRAEVFLALGDGLAGGLPVPGGGGRTLDLDADSLFSFWLSLPPVLRRIDLTGPSPAATVPVAIPASAPVGVEVFFAPIVWELPEGTVSSVGATQSFLIQ
ncbi:MAG: right-handed parallel beta-helix repeat-containing protein [Planctomycetota bacterium]